MAEVGRVCSCMCVSSLPSAASPTGRPLSPAAPRAAQGLLSLGKSSLEGTAEAQRRLQWPGPCPRVMGEEAVRDSVGFAERCWALLVKMLLAKC